ncbi:MAG: cytochrome P450 [Solirubrobacteraceae bacterium]|nr:cytochrome P450 [Solirubrobacteraceae bacterium]
MPTPSLPPGPRAPRAIQQLAWMLRPVPLMERCRRAYGDAFTLRIADQGTWVFLAHPDAVKEVFTADPAVLHAGEANRVLRPWLGEHSVLLLDDDAHLAQRRLLLPPFHGQRMQRYEALMTELAQREVARWPAGEPFALWPHMQAVTLEVIVQAIFGEREGPRLDRLRAALRAAAASTTSWRTMLKMATLGPDRLAADAAFRRRMAPVDEVVHETIAARRAEHERGGERDDILSLLLDARHEDGSPMTDAELRDELMTLLVAGHETSATSLAWAVERLVRHPEALDRLAAGDDDYVDAVVKETLRLRPVIPIVARRATAPVRIAGWDLPAGTMVAPCIHLVHRRPDVYPDPHRFRPERFLERPAGTYTWIPFGGGVRRCLGASFAQFEMRAILRVIARRRRLAPARPPRERARRRAVTLVPDRGAEVVAWPA